MRKILTLLLAIFSFAIISQAQITIFSEGFAGTEVGEIPEGWIIEGLGENLWRVINDNEAGGEAPEMFLDWFVPGHFGFNGSSRLVTPAIDPVGNDVLNFTFKHFFAYFSDPHHLYIQISYDGGEWENLLSFNLVADIPATLEEVTINIPEGTESFRLGWEFNGNVEEIQYYTFDDVLVTAEGGPELPTIDNLAVEAREGATNSDKIEVGNVVKAENLYTVTVTGLEELETVESAPQGAGKWFGLQLQPEGVTDITELEYKSTISSEWNPLTEADAAEAGKPGEIVWWINGNEEGNHNIWLRYAENPDAEIQLTVTFEPYVETSFTIKGVVYNPDGLLSEATVTLETESIETSSSGAFAFENLEAGIYTLTVSKEFHIEYTVTIDTENAVNEILNLGNIRLAFEGYPFYETFAGLSTGSLPEGWAVEELGQENWKINNTNAAGGASPEMYLSWVPEFDGLSRLVSPEIDPMGESLLKFTFKHFYSHYRGTHHLNVQVSYDEGEWENLLSFVLDATFPATDEEVALEIPEGTESFRLAWEFEGNIYDINNYNFDNVIVEHILDHDLFAVSLKGNSTPTVGIETTYTVSVLNTGLESESDYTVKLMTSEDVELASVSGVEIASYETKNISIKWTPGAEDEGPHTIYAEVVLESDQNLANNKTPNMYLLVQPEGTIAITIGDSDNHTAGVNIPFNFYYKSSVAETLYFAEEFGGTGGAITGISYTNHFVSDLTDKSIKIWIGTTEAEDMQDGWILPEDLTLVYDGTMDFPSGENTIVIPFDLPFIYAGGNIVLYNNRVTDDQYHSNQDKFFTSEDKESKRTRFLNSDQGVDPEAPATGTASDWYPNTTFFFSTEDLGSLEGTVTDGTLALEGVQVGIVGTVAKAYTDENGKYAFPALMAGSYDLNFSKVGFYDYVAEEVEVIEGDATVLDVEMDKLPNFEVIGVVTDINNDPLQGATITLLGEETYTTETDENGDFIFNDVFLGDYTLSIKIEGYKTWEESIAVNDETADDQSTVNLGTFALIGMVEVIIGESATFPPTRIPFDFYWKNSLAQTIYYANEINLGAGWIHSVVYSNSFSRTLEDKNIKMWIGETDVENLNDDWVDLEGLTKVFDGIKTFPIGDNEIEIIFDEPYEYNGGNLVIYTNRVMDDAFATGNEKFYGSEFSDSKRTRHRQSDTETLDPENPGAGTVINWVPNTSIMVVVDGLGTLSGTIVDAETDDGIEGALITISNSNATAVTDEDGEFMLQLFPDTYDVTVSYFGYETHVETDVVIGAGDDVVISVELEPLALYTITGIVKDNISTTIEGASVTLTGEETYTATTSASGVFNFEEVMEGTYNLSITKEGYEPYNTEVNTSSAVAGVVDLETITLTEIIVAPYGLMAELEDETSVRFSWNNMMGLFDDFESYEDFIIEDIGDYTLYDGDGSTTYAFSGVLFPNSAYVGSYIIFNPSQTTPDMNDTPAIQPHSGDKFLGCFAATSGPNNDWVITPKFTAAAGMKFSFYAKTYMDYGLEQFKVAISTTNTDVESFEFITDVVNAPLADWGYFEYDLSDYAGQDIHAAIVCVSNDVFVFMVDDLAVEMDMGGKTNLLGYTVPNLSHYSAAQNVNTRAFTGYKVYLDGEMVAETTAEEYLFEGLTIGETYTAGVRSVYTTGESDMATLMFIIPEPPVFYTVKGAVKDSEGALANVEVKLDTYTTTTAADGTFSFTEVEEGAYTLTIDHDGYAHHEQPVNTDNAVDGIVDLGDILLDPVGIMDNTLSTLSAYPNPFHNQLNISHPELVERVIVTNAIGQRIMDITLNGKGYISTDMLSQGIYLITFQGFDGDTVVKTLMKE